MSDGQKQRSPLPPVATGIALGLWVALMLVLAFVLVPMLFAVCAPQAWQQNSPGP